MFHPDKESNRLEFKAVMPRKDQILKTVCGFANQFGGQLILGVADSGEILGISEEEALHLQQFMDQHIVQGIYPPIIPQVSAQRFESKLVIVIQVAPGSQKPYYVKSEGPVEGVYVRLGPSTHRATPELLEELRWQSRGRSWDTIPFFHATPSDLSQELLDQFSRHKRIPSEITESLLEHYQIIVREQSQLLPTSGGLLLFAEDPQRFMADSFIICTHFKHRGDREVVATRDCRGPLMQQLADAMEFVLSRLNWQYVIRGTKREESLEIPEQALREAITNAILHRNYGLSSPIKILIDRDSVEVWSPGGFAAPMTSSQFRSGMTHARNPLIARVFRDMRLAERLGSGLTTILDTYQAAGLEAPQILEGPNYVKVILSRHATKNGSPNVHEELLRVVESLGKVSIEELSQRLALSTSTVRRRLLPLVEEGRIVREGLGRATLYRPRGPVN